MPRKPIDSRECFYDTVQDGTFRDLDWNVVGTELGVMVEPRSISAVPIGTSIVQVDVIDTTFNRRSPMDEDAFIRLHGTGGRLIPVNFLY